jgi:hypothetical protein
LQLRDVSFVEQRGQYAEASSPAAGNSSTSSSRAGAEAALGSLKFAYPAARKL